MLLKLIRIRLQGITGSAFGKKGSSKGKTIFLLLLLGYCVVVFGALFYLVFSALAEPLHDTPFAWFFFALVGLLSFGISFFFTAFAAKSELFEAKDNELLLSLPIRTRTILISRLCILLGSEYLFSLLVMIPAGIAWARFDGMSFLPRYLIGCLSLPLFTAALASVVGWLLALLTANVRRKNLITMLLSIGFMVLYYYVYLNMQDYVNQILASYQQISESIVGWGFVFHWLGLGIAEGKLVYLFLVVGLCLVVFALALWMMSHRFLRIISGSRASHKRRQKALHYEVGSVGGALLRREFQRLLSLPVYMLNCGLGVLAMPAVAIVFAVNADSLSPLLQQLSSSELMISYLAALLLSTMTSMCSFTAPSVSLEAKTLWILRSAPISAKQILMPKLYMHLILTCIPTLIASCVIAAVLQCSLTGWVLIVLLPQIANLLSASLGLMAGIRFAKMDWTNETVPVKQSLAPFLSTLVTMLLPLVLFALLLWQKMAIKPYVLFTIVLYAALCAACLIWLERKGCERFDRL